MMTASLLRAEGMAPGWLGEMRAVLLTAGVLWSAWLGARLIRVGAGGTAVKGLAWLVWLTPVSLIAGNWIFVFYIW